MFIKGKKYKVGGIGEVCTRKDCRGKGYNKIILNKIIKDLAE